MPTTTPSTLHPNPSAAALPYNSALSLWLAVGPLSDKYPNLSPYVYCANNPVVMKDEDGRDYEVVVDDEKKTITIRATYYTSKEFYSDLQKGLDVWNNESGNYTYTESNSNVEYSVQFDLTANVYDSYEQAQNATPYRRSNFNLFRKDPDIDGIVRGCCVDGFEISIATDAPLRSIVHEIGHTLGINESSNNMGVMVSGGDEITILDDHIMTTLKSAGISSQNGSSYNAAPTTPLYPMGEGAKCIGNYNFNGLFRAR